MSSPIDKEIPTSIEKEDVVPVATATPITSKVVRFDEHLPKRHDDREKDTGIFRAFFCVYQAFSWNLRCRGTAECLCLRKTACFECVECGGPEGTAAQSRGMGFLTELSDDEYCRTACHCCDYALIRPRLLCGQASHVCCVRQVASLPHHPDYVDEWVCANWCISCLPDCQIKIAAKPLKCPALDHMQLEMGVAMQSMDRGQGKYVTVSQADTEML